MGWKEEIEFQKEQWVAMLTPDWFLIKMTLYIFFLVFVPVGMLLYVFTSLIFG